MVNYAIQRDDKREQACGAQNHHNSQRAEHQLVLSWRSGLLDRPILDCHDTLQDPLNTDIINIMAVNSLSLQAVIAQKQCEPTQKQADLASLQSKFLLQHSDIEWLSSILKWKLRHLPLDAASCLGQQV